MGQARTKPPVNVGVHAFTFRGEPFGGYVQTFEEAEDVVTFTYAYFEDGSNVVGSFTGEVNGTRVTGAWKEIAKPPLDGVSSFNGGASLEISGAEGRRLLRGEWTFKDAVAGRWKIDIGPVEAE